MNALDLLTGKEQRILMQFLFGFDISDIATYFPGGFFLC